MSTRKNKTKQKSEEKNNEITEISELFICESDDPPKTLDCIENLEFVVIPPSSIHTNLLSNPYEDIQVFIIENVTVVLAANEFKNGIFFISFCSECENKQKIKFNSIYGLTKNTELEHIELIYCTHILLAISSLFEILGLWKSKITLENIQEILVNNCNNIREHDSYKSINEKYIVIVRKTQKVVTFERKKNSSYKCLICAGQGKCVHMKLVEEMKTKTTNQQNIIKKKINRGNLIEPRSSFTCK